jgi:hypothetical protein
MWLGYIPTTTTIILEGEKVFWFQIAIGYTFFQTNPSLKLGSASYLLALFT